MSQKCGVLMTPAGVGTQLYCTEPKGHDGQHVCTVGNWPLDDSPVTKMAERCAALEAALRQALKEIRAGYGLADLMPDSTAEFLEAAEALLSGESGTKEPRDR